MGVSTWLRRTALLAALLSVVSVAAGCGDEMFRLREPGEPLPKMTLNDLQGQPQTLDPAALEKPVLLYFWSVYCPNCKEAIPALVEMARRKDENALAIWAINVDGERHSKAVRGYVRNLDPPFLVVFDRLEGEYLVAADPLGVSKTPTLYLADEAGKVLLRQVIKMDLSAVTTALAELHP